jgi:tetratricopeptide (TPR) repeat protein
MIARWLPLSLCTVVFAPGLLRAQENRYHREWRFETIDSAANNEKLHENIEIFRRILDRKLQPLYPTYTHQTFGMAGMQGGMMGMQAGMGGMMPGMPGMQGGMGGGLGGGMGMAGGMMPVVVPMRSLEGVYLKGQGVVYTATLSSLDPPSKAAKAEIIKPVSEWESVRRQLHNEKEEPKKPEASKPQSLSDVLLKELAENGHHFSQLGDDESLTIVLTVHETSTSASTQKSGGSGAAKTESKAANTSPGLDDRGKGGDLELLGDLHQRQGHYQEAITSFQKAMELKPGSKEAASLYRKLAQCYLALERIEEAQTSLNRYTEFLKNAQLVRNPKSSSENAAKLSPTVLPVKLIISVPKKLLGEIKAGRISFEDFCRQANVESVRFGERR